MIRCETSRTALGPLCPTAPSMLPGVNSSDLQIVDDDTDKLTITVEHPYLASVGLDDDLIAGIQYEGKVWNSN